MALSASITLLHLVLEAFVHTHAIDLGKHGARESSWLESETVFKQTASLHYFFPSDTNIS